MIFIGACSHSAPDHAASNRRSVPPPTSTPGEPSDLADRLANSIPDDVAECAGLRDPADVGPGAPRLEQGHSLVTSDLTARKRAQLIDVVLDDERLASVSWASGSLAAAHGSDGDPSAAGLVFESDEPVAVPTVLGTFDVGSSNGEGQVAPTVPGGFPALRPLTPAEEALFAAAHEVGVVIDADRGTVRAVVALKPTLCRVDPGKRWSE